MSTPHLNVLLTASIATYDNGLPNTPLLSNINPGGSLPFGAASSFRDDYLQALVGGTTIALPAPTSYVWWVWNRDTNNTVLVTPTYNVLGVAQMFVGPGDVGFYFNASKSNGFTAFALTGLNATVLCQVFLAG